MKLLMFDTDRFWYRTFSKTLEQAAAVEGEVTVTDAIVVFVNVEKEDEEASEKAVRKAVDNVAWLARKTGRQKIVLHSFAHLSESKSGPGCAQKVMETMGEKLAGKGYEVASTPFGYLLEFDIHVRGESLAKVWKTI
jgi:polysaccharide deacetylase 2 family uncharacterized protein YibQ